MKSTSSESSSIDSSIGTAYVAIGAGSGDATTMTGVDSVTTLTSGSGSVTGVEILMNGSSTVSGTGVAILTTGSGTGVAILTTGSGTGVAILTTG